MKNAPPNQLALFNVSNHEYNILISPAYRVKKRVSAFKQALNREIGLNEKDLNSVGGISLLKFRFSDNDNMILQLFKQALMYAKKFPVEMDGVGFFQNGKDKKTAYLNIVNPEPIIYVYKTLLRTFRLQEKEFLPHLTIARSLTNSTSGKLKNLLANYHDKFLCDRITVLKKTDNGPYTKIYEAYLN